MLRLRTIGLMLLALLCLPSVAGADEAPDFVLKDMQGNVHRLSDYRGKWVVVNYWATWCPPCLEEIPQLIFFHDKHKDSDALVLGVDMEKQPVQDLAEFVEEQMISYPVLTYEEEMTLVGPVPGLPTTYLIAPDGSIVGRKVGGVTTDSIESAMRRLSGQASAEQ